jgi:hypothetical protein
MKLTSPAGANCSTLISQRRVCLVPGSSQLVGARIGALSNSRIQVQQAVCSAGVAHPGEVR